jgi:hypothetical protein
MFAFGGRRCLLLTHSISDELALRRQKLPFEASRTSRALLRESICVEHGTRLALADLRAQARSMIEIMHFVNRMGRRVWQPGGEAVSPIMASLQIILSCNCHVGQAKIDSGRGGFANSHRRA